MSSVPLFPMLADSPCKDKSIRALIFSWALCFWAFFHFTCDASKSDQTPFLRYRAAIACMIFLAALASLMIAIFQVQCKPFFNLCFGVFISVCGGLYLVAGFIDIDDVSDTGHRLGFQLFGHYVQPSVVCFFLGLDLAQHFHEYVELTEYHIRVGVYSFLQCVACLSTMIYWYGLDQNALSTDEKAYEAGQFFVFTFAVLIFFCHAFLRWGHRSIVLNVVLAIGIFLGGIIVLISGVNERICLGCSTFWCNGHVIGYYFLLFTVVCFITVDVCSPHQKT